MTLELPANSQPAGEILKSDPALKKQLSALKDSENARVLQILDSRTGAQRAAMVIDTGKGSYRIRDVEVCKEFVIVSDSQNRVVVYSRESGATVGRTFGSLAAVDPAGMRIAVRNTGGEIRLHDLATMTEQDRFQFASTVSRAAFRSDGQVLNVLTSAQEVLRLDVSKQ